MLVDEADGHGTLACGRCHPLDRSASNIPYCEDTGPAGLERKRCASERPPRSGRRREEVAGEDESAVVQGKLISEPADLRICANENEHGARIQYPARPALIVLGDDAAEFPVGDELANFGAVQDLDAGLSSELVCQVA